MDAFHFSNVRAEKASAMPRYNLFASIAKTLRILELCLALLLLSWIVARFPLAVRVSGEYLRKLSGFVGSPLFVFVISNSIIAALVAQSGRFTGGGESSTDHGRFPSEYDAAVAALSRVAVAEEVEYQDKQIISEINTTAASTLGDRAESDTCTEKNSDEGTESDFKKVYRRSQLEKWKGEDEAGNKTVRGKLRRSETEKVENLYPQDKLSNEEFQRTIEAFIAKQMRFLREESLAIFVQTSETINQPTKAKSHSN